MRSYVTGAMLTSAAFLLMVAVIVQASVLFFMATTLLLILLLAQLQASLALRWLNLRRIAPNSVNVGDRVAIRYRVTNSRQLRTPLLLLTETFADRRWMRDLEPAPPFSPPPGGVTDVEYHFTPVRRGRYAPEQVSLGAGDALGVAWKEKKFPAEQQSLLVLPRPEPVPLDLMSVVGWGMAEAESGQTEGGGIDPRGVREYLPGDSLRHIHWRSSARMNKLQVRQFEAGNMAEVTLILDTRVPRGGALPYPALEKAIRNVAFVAKELLRTGTTVRLLGQGIEGPATHPKRGMRHYHTILETLAAIEPIQGPGVAVYTQRVLRDIATHSTIFWFTADVSDLPAPARELMRRSCSPRLYLYRLGSVADLSSTVGMDLGRRGIAVTEVRVNEREEGAA